MKRTRLFLLVICLLTVTAAASAYAFMNRSRAKVSSTVQAEHSFDPKSWAWSSEEHWIVDQCVRDTAEMLVFSANKPPAELKVEVQPKGPQAYTAILSGAGLGPRMEVQIRIGSHPWDPEVYRGLASSLVASLNPSPDPIQEGPKDLLNRLLHPRPSEIDVLQGELSAALRQHPRSAELHEQAAMTLASIGLFNPIGNFKDHRFLLCRIVSHLNVARALRPVPGTSGRLAGLAVQVLTARTRTLVQDIEAARKEGSLPSPWLDTLYMLATSDWRKVEDPTKVSLGEALASFKGRNLNQGAESAYQWIGRTDLEACRGTVARLSMTFDYSVSMGHQLNEDLLAWDLQEIQTIHKARNGGRGLPLAKVPGALNAYPGRAYNASTRSLEVVGWGVWARLFQANLLDSMSRKFDFLAHKFGSKESAEAFLNEIEGDFGSLDQFPALQKRYSYYRHSVYPEAIGKATLLLQKHPELVSVPNWASLVQPVFESLPKGLPRYQDWVTQPVPAGTAMDWGERTQEMKEFKKMDLESIRRVREIDPYSQWLINWTCSFRRPTPPTREDIEEAYAAIKDFAPYSYSAHLLHVYSEDSPESLEIARKIADLRPKETLNLAWRLLRLGKEAEAAAAYQKAFDIVEDRVRVSNAMGWVVPYLYRNGKTAAAEKIAREGAEVYSEWGLFTMAHLRELQGKLDEAAVWFAKAEERYGRPTVQTMGFYHRHRTDRPEFAERFRVAQAKWFSRTLRECKIGTEPNPPVLGVTFKAFNDRMKSFGLTKDAITVGVDGFKTRNVDEFLAIRSCDFRDEITLIVYQDNQYKTLKGKVINRQFGVGLANYRK